MLLWGTGGMDYVKLGPYILDEGRTGPPVKMSHGPFHLPHRRNSIPCNLLSRPHPRVGLVDKALIWGARFLGSLCWPHVALLRVSSLALPCQSPMTAAGSIQASSTVCWLHVKSVMREAGSLGKIGVSIGTGLRYFGPPKAKPWLYYYLYSIPQSVKCLHLHFLLSFYNKTVQLMMNHLDPRGC